MKATAKWLVQSMKIALSTYSRIPAGRAEWTEQNKRWALCFFPLVGVAVGALWLVWSAFCARFAVSGLLKGAIDCAISVLVTGGIHLDGFCDTCDALASWQPPERRLEILKDSHAGAFAIIKCCLYFVVLCAAYGSVGGRGAAVVAIGFVLSRSLSGLSAVTMKGARKEGFLQSFMDAADAKGARVALALVAAVSVAGMIICAPLEGALAVLAAGASYWWYRRVSTRYFGGITGDLAGWFLCVCELAMALAAAVGGCLL